MMTAAFGRLLRLAAVVALAGMAVGCAAPRGPTSMTAPPGYGNDAASRVARLIRYCDRLAEDGELVTALGLCARAHEIDPDHPEPLMKVASILQALDRGRAAMQTYDALLQRHPMHHEAQYRLGKLYMERGEAGLASVHFDRARRSDPQDPRAYNALGILRDQAGEHAAAQELYRLALERDPANLSVRNNLGLSLALAGQRDQAIELLAELAVDPEAGRTVLRNLEAAYASRTPAAAGSTAVAPMQGGAQDGVPGDPIAPVARQPLPDLAPDLAPQPAPATMKRPRAASPAPEAGVPMPLFPPPATAGGQQSGVDRPTGSAASSAILAAAERLMQPPGWADFEPGVLLGKSVPAPETRVQDAAAGDVIIDIPAPAWPAPAASADMTPDAYSLSMLVLNDGVSFC